MCVRTDALDWLRLCLVPGVSGRAQRALLRRYGSPAAAVAATKSTLAEVVGSTAADALVAGPPPGLLASTLEWLDQPGHHFLVLGDKCYPHALLETPDPPTALYALGRIELLQQPTIAIVGSRNASRQGMLDAHDFAQTLSRHGFGIASGLALGIDSAAHRGGLAGHGSTIAVVGTGLDRVYPERNRDLAWEIAAAGVVVTEFPLMSAPLAANFPRRNRIISGLSRGVLVVEATMKSGSLTSARFALEQGREVFAIPGSIHSPLSKGCHWLIKQGAKLVETADDVLVELGATPARAAGAEAPVRASPESPLFAALGHSPASADALASGTGMPAADIVAELTRLELDGRIERMPGGLYRLLAVT